MTKPTIFLLLCAILPLAVACEEKSPENAAPTEAAEEKAPTAEKAQAPAEEPPAPPENRGWSLTVTGYEAPSLTGKSVMTMNMAGGTATYRLTSPRMMGMIDLANTKVGEAGKFSPYSMVLNYLDEQITCGMSSTEKDSDLTLTISKTATGMRGEFQGKVTCGPAAGGERKPANITGWFEK